MAVSGALRTTSNGGFVRVNVKMSCAKGLRDSMPRVNFGCNRSQLKRPATDVGYRKDLAHHARFLGPRNNPFMQRCRTYLYQLLQIVTASGSGCVRLPYRIPNEVWHNHGAYRAGTGPCGDLCDRLRLPASHSPGGGRSKRFPRGQTEPARSPSGGNTRTD